jgi:hypothetical protein
MATVRIAALAALLVLGLAADASAQRADGIDNDGDGQIDEPDEYDGAGLQPGGMEAECQATARAEICLPYFQFHCQTNGFPLACRMAQIGQACLVGDAAGCDYFRAILQANTACSWGDAGACQWIMQQGLS